jgi:inhibitor of cysteine peptidase
MYKVFSRLLLVTLFFLPQLSCASNITLDDTACGTRQSLTVGDVLELRLPGNPTTGYTWQVTALPSQLQQQGLPVHRRDSQMLGAGGVTSFIFSTTTPGDATLELVYRRPWEQNTPPLKTCRIQLNLQANK